MTNSFLLLVLFGLVGYVGWFAQYMLTKEARYWVQYWRKLYDQNERLIKKFITQKDKTNE